MIKNFVSKQSISITGVILAGGLARRMNQKDKALLTFACKHLFRHGYDILEPQVDTLFVNANRNQQVYKDLGYKVIEDDISGFAGPLAGMATALNIITTTHILIIPCDSPFLPDFFVDRFVESYQKTGADICVAHDGDRLQPVFALINKSTLPSLLDYLNKGQKKIDSWYQQQSLATVDFSDSPNTFININTPEDLKKAEILYDSK